MKKILYLGIILMLASCGSDEVVTEPSNELESAAESESATPTVNVNGREVSIIKIDNLEVMNEDLGIFEWDDAMKACADLGDGWRLPTKKELNILYENKDKIGGFAGLNYWSSTEEHNSNAWYQHFYDGSQSYVFKDISTSVHAVRSI